MRKKNFLLVILLMAFSISFIGCGQEEVSHEVAAEESDSAEVDKETMPKDSDSEEERVEEEESISQIGNYTSDDIIQNSGFYIAYEDETFDAYPGGGKSLDNGEHGHNQKYYDEFYFDNAKVDRIPLTTDMDQIVAVWEGDCDVYLYPVQSEIYAIRVSASDLADEYADILGDGYGIINPKADSDGYYLSVEYDDYEGTKSYDVAYINGKPASEYELVHTIYEYTYEDLYTSEEKSSKRDYYGLQRGDTVTLGIPYGTTLVEYECTQDVTCFISSKNLCSVGEAWYYAPSLKPTTQGYALLDFSEVPDGKYIMILNGNGKYLGTILNLQHN